MMLFMFSINLMFTLIFMTLTHPLSMGLILLIQTLIVSLITGHLTYNYWFSYILFLILIGGMLILFMYMTSIASNEKFKFNIKLIATSIIIPMTLSIPIIKININLKNNEMLNWNSDMMINYSLNKYINYPTNLILLFMIIYLLLALVATVKITDFKYGPLRQMN